MRQDGDRTVGLPAVWSSETQPVYSTPSSRPSSTASRTSAGTDERKHSSPLRSTVSAPVIMFDLYSTRVALVVAGLLLGTATSARKIIVKNSCGVKVFAAYAGQGGSVQVGGKPAPAGWEIPEGNSTTLDVPESCAFTLRSQTMTDWDQGLRVGSGSGVEEMAALTM